MKYADFEYVMSAERMQKYLSAYGGNTRNAMTLYRKNLHLSQDMFTVVSCFEVAMRNAIDRVMKAHWGNDWLRDSVQPGGIFDTQNTLGTKKIIQKAYQRLLNEGNYSHSKLLAELEFGVWKYMFAPHEFRASGRILLRAFPNRPRSSAAMQYNHTYVFNELDKVNKLRNRIAHHEPICFDIATNQPNASYVVNEYHKISILFAWMNIDSQALLYGLDHVMSICRKL